MESAFNSRGRKILAMAINKKLHVDTRNIQSEACDDANPEVAQPRNDLLYINYPLCESETQKTLDGMSTKMNKAIGVELKDVESKTVVNSNTELAQSKNNPTYTVDPRYYLDESQKRQMIMEWVSNGSMQQRASENQENEKEMDLLQLSESIGFSDHNFPISKSSSSTTIISSSSIEDNSLTGSETTEKAFENVANKRDLFLFYSHLKDRSQSVSNNEQITMAKESICQNEHIFYPENNVPFVDNGKKSASDVKSNNEKDIFDFTNTESSSGSSIVPLLKRSKTINRYLSSDAESSKDHNTAADSKNRKTVVQESSRKTFDRSPVKSSNTFKNYVEKNLNKKNKKRTLCKFCRISVTNFERHLYRHHIEEKEVQEYIKLPKNTKDGRQMRRNILALLRYEMDFKNYVDNENYNSEKLPCAHCKRIIAVKYLRRHYKKCIIKPINTSGSYIRHRAISQTLLTCASDNGNVNATIRVKNEVFSRMATDEIGFLARKDCLIRHFGEHYLKKHKRAQISIACSNKMRECARLLIEMRRRINKPNLSFFELLNPVLFDDVILSAKSISGYDNEKKIYKAPSLALHLGTTLQQICDVTTHLLLKNSSDLKVDNTEVKLKDVKRFRFLVQTQWTNEVSSLALKDLAEKKWNKPVMLPLTKDIIEFRNHILDIANKNVALLKKNITDEKAFKALVDASLAFTILFNRRRIGDVQYVEIDSYLNSSNMPDQTEILEQLTDSEKTLTSSYKRVIAGGKGSRAIVILFPKMLQDYINLLLDIRNKTNIVPEQNKYLFAYPGVTKQWVRGDVILMKFAKSSKIENPETMTSNRLRKQIATLMQIMNLDKNDYSQFAKFMGHTEKTHQEFYEITQDAYQTAKVAKLLNLFDKGKGLEYRNKDLEKIDIDPNEISAESDEENNELDESESRKSSDRQEITKNEPDMVNSRIKGNRIRWTNEQKTIAKLHFQKHIKRKIAPRKNECEEFILHNKNIFHNLDWVKVKTFIYNQYKDN